MTEILATFLAGLSLFLAGINDIKVHLQQITSRRFRRLLARWTDRPLIASLWGVALGAITQSSTAVAFILVSVISSGLMTVSKALPVVAWANLGTALLVLLAAVNIHVAVLYLIGLAGLMNIVKARGKVRILAGALFGIGILFLGLKLMKDAFAPLPSFPWFASLTGFLHGSIFACFLLGCLLRVVIQSSSAIAIIAIALAQGGLLKEDQAMLMMFGTGAGVAVAVFLLGANIAGIPRQITLFQGGINFCASLLLLFSFYFEVWTGLPLINHLLQSLSSGLEDRLAYSFVALQSVCVCSALILQPGASRWLARLSPPTLEQDLSKLHFIHDQALEDPVSALELVDKEILRLLKYVPQSLDSVRDEGDKGTVDCKSLHLASGSVAREVQNFLADLVNRPLTREASGHLLRLERRLALTMALSENVFGLVQTIECNQVSPRLAPLLHNIVEAIATLLLSTVDAVQTGDAMDIELLQRMTEDRGDMMERLRRAYINAERELAHQDRATLFYITSLFERGTWIMRQISLSLQKNDEENDSLASL